MKASTDRAAAPASIGQWGAIFLVLIAALLWTLLAATEGYAVAFGALLLVGLAPLATVAIWRRPELGIYTVLALLVFSAEYSQTEWGVRSAADLATLYNRRVIPGVIASVFDLLFATLVLTWLARKILRREKLVRPPRLVTFPLLLSLLFTLYGLLLGLFRLQEGFELYHIMREARPLIYTPILFLMTLDIIALRRKVNTLWKIIVLLAFIRGVQGVILHYLGIGRWYYGTTMVYYDYSDTIYLLAALGLLLAWLLGRQRLHPRVLLGTALLMLPMLYAFLFSYRRSFWIGAAIGMPLLFVAANGREKQRYLALAGLGLLAGLAFVLADPFGQVELLSQRVASIVDAQTDPSNYFRVLDTENALNAIYESGALGMGFGSHYRIIATVPWLNDFITHVSRASHNGYLYLTMKMGVLGLLSWTLFWTANLVVAFWLLIVRNARYRHIGLGAILLLSACAVANLFLPLYYNLRPLLLLSIVCALVVAAWRAERAPVR